VNLILIHITNVRAGELPEDQLFAAVRSMEPHHYSEEWQDRHLAELKHTYDWWNDRFEISTSYRLPKLTIVEIMEIAREFMDDLVRLAISYHDRILIHMPSA
jgi:hypothetical protein